MNVACPECTTVFRVDPAKVPERGVRARCSVCGGLIAVRRPSVGVPAVPPLPSAPAAAVTPPAPVAPEPPTAPPEPAAAPPTMPPAEPTAPVMPFSALPETPPIVPLSSPPSAPASPPPPSAPAGGGHFTNPFLQQDPGTRARRLARALVSDLVVYHPDKRQRGLSEGNLKELFAEEIRKSWEEYSEQIGEQVARETNYFTEALNEILAEGRPLFS
jgi:predicted Zn finger-like uncharacterized protein